MNTGFIFARYRVAIDGSYINDKQLFPLSQRQINDFNLKVGNLFDEILRRQTGQAVNAPVDRARGSKSSSPTDPKTAPRPNTFGRLPQGLDDRTNTSKA
jgi:hypothetical protein